MKRKILFVMTLMFLLVLSGCIQVMPSSDSVTDMQNQDETQQSVDIDVTEVGQNESSDSFKNLDLNIEKGTLCIYMGDTFSYTYHGGQNDDYEIENNTFSIHQSLEGEAVLTLPETSYETLTLNVGNGHVYVYSDLSLQNFVLDVIHGEVNITNITVVQGSTINIKRGSAYVTGGLGQFVDAQSNEGHLSLVVLAAQSDYNYTVSLSNGSLHLGTKNYKGRSSSDNINNGASQTMTLNCSKGDMSIEFKNND